MTIPEPNGGVALVTGASSGIGAALARQLSDRGHELVLVARRRDRLESLRAELPTKATVQCADLADHADRRRLIGELIDGPPIDIAVLSAGFGIGGPFMEHDESRLLEMMRTNVEATVHLAHAIVPPMVARRRGALLLVSSMAGEQPMPNFAAYAATKAAITSLARALNQECASYGVTVSALSPGGVRTEFAQVGGLQQQERRATSALMMDVDDCAAAAIRGLESGRRVIIPGRSIRAMVRLARVAPARLWLPLCQRVFRP